MRTGTAWQKIAATLALIGITAMVSVTTVGCSSGNDHNLVSSKYVDPASPEVQAQIAANEACADKNESLIAAIEKKLVLQSDGTIEIKSDSRSILSQEEQAFADSVLAETNSKVKHGEIWIDTAFNIHLKDGSRANESGIKYYWWGYRSAWNNTTCQRVIGALTAGAGVSFFIPGGGQVVSAILTIGIGVLIWVSAPGRGIYIYTVWGGAQWMTSQP